MNNYSGWHPLLPTEIQSITPQDPDLSFWNF